MIRLIAFIALVFLFALATSTLAAEPATATVRIDRLEKLATYIEKLSPDRLFMPSYHGSAIRTTRTVPGALCTTVRPRSRFAATV